MKSEAASGLSAAIAAHVVQTPAASLSADTLHAAKRALLDGLGVMLAASGTSAEIAPFIAQAKAAGDGPCAVLGHDMRTSPIFAALANGSMAHALDYEDAFDAAPCHPNASLLSAVFAIAQADALTSGEELLAAIAIGCDLVCRIGLALRRPMEDGGWYPPPILGAFGAAAAAGRLHRLNQRQMLDSFSLMLTQTCPGEIKYSRDTVLRAVREAFPAQAAVQSTLLAAAGIRGFDAPFEGKAGFFRLYADAHYDPAALLDQLGERYWIERLSFKPWPACRGTHAYIEAAQSMRPIDPDSIVEIIATGGEVQRMLVEPLARKQAPTVAIDAKFSIPFTVAAAFLDADVTLDSFDAASLADPRKRALASRVRFEQRPDTGRDSAQSGVLTVRCADGTERTTSIDIAAGHPDRPLSDTALRVKFADCAARALHPIAPVAAEALADAVFSLEKPDSMRLLMASLR
ncbi:MmgE/PrpD family protein [Roseiterribacter gracilis]|uniref:2-methylcitrate dehydratase n=1 Tax=Roseiterribacter gracilis TaxID=2812848 RepID=A0A8S8XI59_9PROT|nr:hypothetical protein TMPK1_38460 [Rhodospirillales bacterium TMPK1]